MRKFSFAVALLFCLGMTHDRVHAAQASIQMPMANPSPGSNFTLQQFNTSYLNPALATLQSNFSGPQPPASPVLGQLWTDTSVTPSILRIYSGVAWIQIGSLIANGFIYPNGTFTNGHALQWNNGVQDAGFAPAQPFVCAGSTWANGLSGGVTTCTQPQFSDISNVTYQLYGVPHTWGGLQNFSAGAIIPFTQSGAGAVTYTLDAKARQIVSLMDFGALGNSNGTHGNGNDDTPSIQAALNTGAAFAPKGLYRITSPITETAAGPFMWSAYAGAPVYNDASSATGAFSFNLASYCPISFIPCTAMYGLNIISPYAGSTGNFGVYVNKSQGAKFRDASIQAQAIGISASNSFGLTIEDSNISNSGTNAIYAPDSTLNIGSIIQNKFYGNGSASNSSAIYVGSSNGGLRIVGNDIESNYSGIITQGVNEGCLIESNYFETSNVFDFYNSGTMKGCRIDLNRIGSGLSTTWSSIQQSEIAYNVFGGGGGTITLPASANVHDIIVEGGASVRTNATLPTNCGTGPSISSMATDYAGLITTGATATTTCQIAFAGTYVNAPVCVATPNGSVSSFYISVTTGGIVFNYSSSAALKISYQCNITY